MTDEAQPKPVELECGCVLSADRRRVETMCSVAAGILADMPFLAIDCLETRAWASHYKYAKDKKAADA